VSQRQNAAIDANADAFPIRRVGVLREMTSVIIGLSAGIPATSIGSRSGRGGNEGAVGFYASATPCAVLKTLEELQQKLLRDLTSSSFEVRQLREPELSIQTMILRTERFPAQSH